MSWYATSVTTRYEMETALRISQAGFEAYCPVAPKKYSAHSPGRNKIENKFGPLFTGYVFVRAGGIFQKDKFQTPKVRLIVWRNVLVTEAQMDVVRATEKELAEASKRKASCGTIAVGDIVNLRNALFADEPVEVLKRYKRTLLVRFTSNPGFRPIEVAAGHVEKVA